MARKNKDQKAVDKDKKAVDPATSKNSQTSSQKWPLLVLSAGAACAAIYFGTLRNGSSHTPIESNGSSQKPIESKTGGFSTDPAVRRELLLQLGQENGLASCDLDVLDAADPMAQERFEANYYLQKPVVLRLHSPVPSDFGKQALEDMLGSTHVRLGFGSTYAIQGVGSEVKANFGDFMRNLTSEAQAGRFVFSRGGNVESYRDELWRDVEFRKILHKLLPGWAPFDAVTGLPRWNDKQQEHLCPLNPKKVCHAILNIGGAGVGISPHFHMDTWLRVLYGEKFWLLTPGDSIPRPGFYDFESVPTIRAAWHASGGNRSWLECVQKAGELLYVPEGWNHAVVNLGETLAVGAQSSQHGGWLSDVLRLLDTPSSEEESKRQELLAMRVTAEHPGLVDAWVKLTESRMRLRSSLDAIKTAAAGAMKANRKDPRAQIFWAMVQLQLGNKKAAKNAAQKLDKLLLLGSDLEEPYPSMLSSIRDSVR